MPNRGEMKLAPCPFCGSEDVMFRSLAVKSYVYCLNCECQGPKHSGEGAMKKWNMLAFNSLEKGMIWTAIKELQKQVQAMERPHAK